MNAWNHAEPGFYDWLLKQTQNPHEAEDIMQEVFLKAMGNSERFCTLQEGKSWLFKMTRNHLVELLRRKIHSVGIEEFVMPIDISLWWFNYNAALVKLTEQERDVIEQCDLNDMAQKDYAEKHLLSLSAVKARLRRARIKLKTILVSECKVTQDQTGVCCFKPYQVEEG